MPQISAEPLLSRCEKQYVAVGSIDFCQRDCKMYELQIEWFQPSATVVTAHDV